jgi:hypothetical protein
VRRRVGKIKDVPRFRFFESGASHLIHPVPRRSLLAVAVRLKQDATSAGRTPSRSPRAATRSGTGEILARRRIGYDGVLVPSQRWYGERCSLRPSRRSENTSHAGGGPP